MATGTAFAKLYSTIELTPHPAVEGLVDLWFEPPRQLRLDGLETAILPAFIAAFPIHVTRVPKSRKRFFYFAGFAAIDALELLPSEAKTDLEIRLVQWKDLAPDELVAMAQSDLDALHFQQFDRRNVGEHLRLHLARRWKLSQRDVSHRTKMSRHLLRPGEISDQIDIREKLFGEGDGD
ncbi:MAG: hypothetical protein AAFX54_02975 [Pseudomonadota bacterium]